jgi:hypothetical protein
VTKELASDEDSTNPIILLIAGIGEMSSQNMVTYNMGRVRDTLVNLANAHPNIKRTAFIGFQEIPSDLTIRGSWISSVAKHLGANKMILRDCKIDIVDLWSPLSLEDLVLTERPGHPQFAMESPVTTVRSLVNLVTLAKLMVLDRVPMTYQL